jgi:uncharacterized glyoxalase superfamily protein PhnB
MTKVTPFLMFNDQLEAAIEFYTATFPDSEIRNVARTGKDGPIASAEFVVGGQSFMGYNGGPYFTFSEGVSLYVDCADQAEVDEYWDKLVGAGATPTQWRLDQGPVRPLLADRSEAIRRAHPRHRHQEGQGRDGRHDDDGEARRGGARASLQRGVAVRRHALGRC